MTKKDVIFGAVMGISLAVAGTDVLVQPVKFICLGLAIVLAHIYAGESR